MDDSLVAFYSLLQHQHAYFFYLPIFSSVLKSGSLCIFLCLLNFFMNLLIYIIWPLWVLYSMMSAFLFSLNFYIWQSATKHVCYSNIYTTYIAIYVTSQQRMVKNKKTNNNKKKNPTTWLEGERKLSQNLARKNCTQIYSLIDETAIKKKGFKHFPNYWRHGTHCLFQVFFSSFVKWLIDVFLEIKLCILPFVRPTQYIVWNPGFQ